MQAVGPYRVLGEIGSGGMGEVFLAEDTRLHRKVALKALRATAPGDPDAHARLLREARAVAALNHPHIAGIYDIVDATADTRPVIVMEYVPGETLAERLARGRLPVAEALVIAIDVAQALAAAHAHGVIHRDLKPANIRLTPGGEVKVLDFGLARFAPTETMDTVAADEARKHTIAGQVAGTAGYISPEQLHGGPVDGRTDVYSLGVVLFEMIAGRCPFSGDLITAALAALTRPTPRLRDADPHVLPALDALVARMMAVDPAGRPGTAADAARELAQIRSELTLGAFTPVPNRTQPRARTVAYGAAAILIVVLAGASLLKWWPRSPVNAPKERPVIAVMPLTNLSGDVSKDYLGVGIADTLATHLTRVRSVSVVDPTAAIAAKKSDPESLARELGVTLLLQGSVQEQGDRLRVNAKLVRPDGVVAWAGDSDAPASDLFSLESRLANAVMDALSVTLTAAERTEATRALTSSQEALGEYWRGMALFERTDASSLAGAVDAFQRALARDPSFALAHARLADVYRRQYIASNERDAITKAMADAARAVELDPTSVDAKMSLATVLQLTGRNGAAVDELRQVLAQQPMNDEAHRELADILRTEGNPDEARREYQRAIDIRPEYWRNHERLGLFLLASGRASEAIPEFQRVIALRPDGSDGFQQLGTAYQTLGDTDRARENYKRALVLDPRNAQAYANLGTVEYSAGRFAAAAAAYEHAVALQPKRPIGHRNLGDAYVKLGRTADARHEYEQAAALTEDILTVNPSDAISTSRLAVYEAKLGRGDAAKRHIGSAESMNPGNADILYRSAVVYALLNDRGTAMKQLANALDHGYSAALARTDDDLASLATNPEFRRRVGTR